jgi:ribosomal subunit interface protein
MIKRIVFKNMDSSDVMRTYAEEQLAKVEHFLENEREPIYIDLFFEPSKVHEHHRVDLVVKTPHYSLDSHYEHEGMPFYEVVDRVIDIMYKELHKAKERRVDDRKSVGRKEEFKKQR